jgi:DNA-binding transcriptional ArsR family regulator
MPSSTASEDRLDLVFHALADRTRRALLSRLARGPARVTDLAQPFAMSLPAVSKHLKVLEAASLIDRDIDGRVHRCALAPAPLRDIERWLEHYRGFWEGRLEALARFVEDEPKPRKGKK